MITNSTTSKEPLTFYRFARYDSTLYYLQKFLNRFPENKSALSLQANCYFQSNNLDAGLSTYSKLISIYPDDYSILFDNGLVMYKLYLLTRNQEMLDKAVALFQRAVSIYPPLIDDITKAKKQADLTAGR